MTFLLVIAGHLEFVDPEYGVRFSRVIRSLMVWLLKGPPDLNGAKDKQALVDLVFFVVVPYCVLYTSPT